MNVDPSRLSAPLIEPYGGLVPSRASQLLCQPCSIDHARVLIHDWHSRLPTTQAGPWKVAYCASFDGLTYAVALWNNPSARTLPRDWLELRRMAVSDDAPHCTASWFLAAMLRDVHSRYPDCPHVISYQDTAVHKGTIYRAAGWSPEFVTKARVRDRSKPRPSGRMYRTSINGADPDASEKIRWGMDMPAPTQDHPTKGRTE